MRAKRAGLTIVLSLLVIIVSCSKEDQLTNSDQVSSSQKAQPQSELTPFQQSIQAAIAERSSDGLPVPDISFGYASDNGLPLSVLDYYPGQPGESFTITATTTLEFAGPAEAGLDQWPRDVIEGTVAPEEGVVLEGDYTDVVKDYIAERVPGVWDNYEYGYEPRTLTLTETFTVTYPEEQPQLTVGDDLVHGFTFTGPDIDWTVTNEACEFGVCAWYFKAGFALDWGFGIRLPMNVSLTSDDPVDEGDTFTPTSMAHGVNWGASDYTSAGIDAESGNEYVMRYTFFLGIQVEIAEFSVVDLGPDIDEDESSSFTTPFGPGSVFNLPSIDAPIYSRDLAKVAFEFGASFTPQAGSDKFIADWNASSDLSGSGSLMYTDPSVTEYLSSVDAIDGPALGNLQINHTKYVFNQFKILLGAYFEIDIFGLYDDRWDIPLTGFDLSSLIPDISVPIHPGANPTALNASVTVQNVAPTAQIQVPGVGLVNGVKTLFADVGEEIPFQGISHDPGRDDLTLEWDFGDGAPAPDVTTNYLLVALTGPHNVTEDQPHTFPEACVNHVTFESTDSDNASSQDALAVVVRSGFGSKARLAGDWRHQLNGVGNVAYTEDELACLLDIVGFMSTVFNEERDASTVHLARDVMHLAGNSDEADRFDRELLVAWLNFAAGVFDLDDMVDTDGDMAADATFGYALAAAEMVRLDPFATDMQLQQQRKVVHYVSTQGKDTFATASPKDGKQLQ